jgi:hypothetical protein
MVINMTNEKIDPLIEEYKQLFAYTNSNALITLKIPPVVLTIASALAIYSKEPPPLFGLGLSLAIFIMLVWLGYCHSMINGIGLKLVEIEQRINRILRLDKDTELSFHSWYIAQGSQILPGFQLYSMFLGLAFCVVLGFACTHFWDTMTTWEWSLRAKTSTVLLLALLNLAPFSTMVWYDRKTYRLKREIINKYERLPAAKGDS